MTQAPPAMPPESPPEPPNLQAVAVSYEHSLSLPALLDALTCSLLITTYQAGRLLCLSTVQGQLRVSFSRFEQAMGLTRTPTGIALATRDAIWCLPASHEIAPRVQPEGEHDIAFLARSSHYTGPVMAHDLAWGGDRLWIVNTLFNCLATPDAPWSFRPLWKPPFISELAPGDRCHLNGLAMAEDGSAAWVTALSESDTDNGWRDHKASTGCLIHVPSAEVVFRGLCMPHSPRLHEGQLYALESGTGSLLRMNPTDGSHDTVATLPGFTRGLDFYAGHSFVGLSQIRESAVFGGLPLQDAQAELRCGLAVVDLKNGAVVAMFWFNSGVEEIFAINVVPGYRHPAVIGPDVATDQTQTIWMVPSAPLG